MTTRGATRFTQPVPPGDLAVERESGDDGRTCLLRWRGNRTAPTAICETTVSDDDAELGFGVRREFGVAGCGPL